MSAGGLRRKRTRLVVALCVGGLAWSHGPVEAQQPAPKGMMLDNELGPNAGRTPAIVGPPPSSGPKNPASPSSSPRPSPQGPPATPRSDGPPPQNAAVLSAPVPQDVLDRVQRLVDLGNANGALSLVEQTIRERGETVPLVLLRGRVLCGANRIDDCLRSINRGIELDGNSADAYLLRARVFAFNSSSTAENRQAALRDFATARRFAPTSVVPLLFTGQFYLQVANDVPKALESFNEAIVLDPRDARAHVWKATSYFDRQQWDLAHDAAAAGLAQTQNSPELTAVRALIRLQRGQTDAARNDLSGVSTSRRFELYGSLGVTALAAHRSFGSNGSIVSREQR